MQNYDFRQLSNWLAVGTAGEPWQALSERPLLILVGVTGVGKSTTVQALQTAGWSFTLLPNRRELTDELIIGQMQAAAGEPVQPETDRIKRFAYTAQYREQYPGGMAHALSQLFVKPQQIATERFVFDGLRGVDELSYAAELLPQATFLVLEAPLVVRVRRLLGRGDAFDRVDGSNTQAGTESLAALLPEAAGLFTSADENSLWQLVRDGLVTAADLQAKLKIVLTERQNYDPDGTRELLLNLAPDRTIIADTVVLNPAQIAQMVIKESR